VIWRGRKEVFLVCWDLMKMNLGRVDVSASFKATDIDVNWSDANHSCLTKRQGVELHLMQWIHH